MSEVAKIYMEQFGLDQRPFSLVPDPDFLFWSPGHRRAYTMLEYGLYTGAPITLISGDVGIGKTTLLHHLLKQVGEDITIGMIANAHGGRGDLLRWVLMALDQTTTPESSYVDLFKQFQTFLIDEYAEGRKVVLIFDEAQNLDRETLEELRMFTNINANKDELLQLILVGQPELRTLVRRPDLTQFAQRIAASFHLSAMDEATVTAYIHHRMERAGAGRRIFTPEATSRIFGATQGIPRLVNQLADFALIYASSDDLDEVDGTTIENVLRDGVFFAGVLRLENAVI
ncbi:AAA family ATPase [uncultured Limimaricola sp.]|uniref:ExeA family protein n=1 Tax=uncultured Limimaricola sp. TaxID=2211667 RepID=UPI0030FA0E29